MITRLPSSCEMESEFCENPGPDGAVAAGKATQGTPQAKLVATLRHLMAPLADDPVCYIMGGAGHPSDTEVLFAAIPALLRELGLAHAVSDRAMHDAAMLDAVDPHVGRVDNYRGRGKFDE